MTQVMKARDVLQWLDMGADDPFDTPAMRELFWENPNILAEEKLDGNRFTMHIDEHNNVRFISSGGKDRTDNFPHLTKLRSQLLAGTILDGEIRCPKAVIQGAGTETKTTTQSTSAIANSLPSTAIRLQRENDAWVEFFVFDVIRLQGEDQHDLTYSVRRRMVESVLIGLNASCLMPDFAVENKKEFFEWVLSRGGEGVMFKQLDGRYEEGKRPKTMHKCKGFVTVDAYVSGWKPGNGKFEGQVGALEFSVNLNDQRHVVGWVGAFSDEERRHLTAPDGSLQRLAYGMVAELRGQRVTKNGRFQHCQIVKWRKEKREVDCDGYELAGLL